MTAVFEFKTVYGNDLIYPVNDVAKRLTALTRKITVTHAELHEFSKLGFDLEYVGVTIPDLSTFFKG